ncbi:unnamed protein product [Adineta steineri]|uniref:Uncharacterized protein n=1 Tax=Adineta steineri TaxID=433720 RepID=A0A820EN73_9BILA|nr:unnamed protein product [Adineta steineri]
MYRNKNPSELPQEQIRRLQNDLNTHIALNEELRKQLTQKVMSNTRNKPKPLKFGKENNLNELPHKTIQRLEENLNHQIANNEKLSIELNNLHKLIDELRDMIIKQNSKIMILENQLVYEKKPRSMIPEAVLQRSSDENSSFSAEPLPKNAKNSTFKSVPGRNERIHPIGTLFP